MTNGHFVKCLPTPLYGISQQMPRGHFVQYLLARFHVATLFSFFDDADGNDDSDEGSHNLLELQD